MLILFMLEIWNLACWQGLKDKAEICILLEQLGGIMEVFHKG